MTAKKRAQFLAALARCGNVSEAARKTHISRKTLYALRKTDADFQAEWEIAVELGVEALEDEARRRAHDGVEEALTSAKRLIFDAAGQPVTVRKYSDTLLIFLLKAARPEKYRDNVHVAVRGQLGITALLEQMRDNPRIADDAAEFVELVDAARQAED